MSTKQVTDTLSLHSTVGFKGNFNFFELWRFSWGHDGFARGTNEDWRSNFKDFNVTLSEMVSRNESQRSFRAKSRKQKKTRHCNGSHQNIRTTNVTPLLCLCSPCELSLPNVKKLKIVLSCHFLLPVLCIETTFGFVLFYGGDQIHDMPEVFWGFRDTVFQSERRPRRGCEDIEKKKKCQYFYWVNVVYVALLKAMIFVSFLIYRKITLPSCDVTWVCCYFINICTII